VAARVTVDSPPSSLSATDATNPVNSGPDAVATRTGTSGPSTGRPMSEPRASIVFHGE
jgi:hypothetical protein